jgi:hypothetical protein
MPLVVVSSKADSQAQIWLRIAKGLGHQAIHLNTERAGVDWRLVVSGDAQVVRRHGPALSLSDPSLCWYLRGPNFADTQTLVEIELLHSLLTVFAYPQARYFIKGGEEGRFGSKPLQLVSFQNLCPSSRISTRRLPRKNRDKFVVKSLSQIRSTVVTCADSRLHRGASLHFEQERIEHGDLLKVHAYMRNDALLQTFVVKCSSGSIVDYRAAINVKYTRIDSDHRIMRVIQKFYQIAGTTFFDIDLFITENEIIILEINFSPAPTFFERSAGIDYDFSRAVLSNFLAASVGRNSCQ